MKISLQSSENIRKQQKELLVALQRAQNLIDSSRHNSIAQTHTSLDDLSTTPASRPHSTSNPHSQSSPILYSFPAPPPAAPYLLEPHLGAYPSISTPSPQPAKLTRKKSSPSTPTAASSSSRQISQRTPISNTHRQTPNSASTLNSRSSGRHNLTPSSLHRQRESPSAVSTRPPLPPSSSPFSSSHSRHIPTHTSPVGISKVRSRPQSAPPRSDRNLSLSHSFLTTPPSSSGRRR